MKPKPASTTTALPGLALIGVAAVLLLSLHPSVSPLPVAETRAITTDQHVDLPLDPTHADAPKPVRPMTTVRIAASDDDSQALKTLKPRVAPFEIVRAADRPDLTFDPKSKTLTERDEVIASNVTSADLPAAADRLALSRGLPGLIAQGEQPIHIQPDGRTFKEGQRFNLVLPDVQDRTVIVFVVSGDGTLQFLFPTRSDVATVAAPELSFAVDASPPLGSDQIVAISSTKNIDDLVTSLRRLDRRKAAGEVLGLVDALPSGTAKFGTVRIMTQR